EDLTFARARYRVHGSGGCMPPGARDPRQRDWHPASVWSRSGRQRFGGHSGGGTPGPIPNPEVKPSSADGTAWETAWESRSPPRHLRRGTLVRGSPFAFVRAGVERVTVAPPAVPRPWRARSVGEQGSLRSEPAEMV